MMLDRMATRVGEEGGGGGVNCFYDTKKNFFAKIDEAIVV